IRFFFFQAEDGIRDRTVTGVQTCALPIYVGEQSLRRPHLRCDLDRLRHAQMGRMRFMAERVDDQRLHLRDLLYDISGNRAAIARSEERRVGKECRCRWWWYHE